jgi:hypothetical protein
MVEGSYSVDRLAGQGRERVKLDVLISSTIIRTLLQGQRRTCMHDIVSKEELLNQRSRRCAPSLQVVVQSPRPWRANSGDASRLI